MPTMSSDAQHSEPAAEASGAAGSADSTAPEVTVLVYSDDAEIREKVRRSVGRKPARDIGRIRYIDTGTEREVIERVDAGGIDLCILDGEAWPAGGMGVSRSLKNELYPCPPIIVAMGRAADQWLAAWSQADATLIHPLDPVRTAAVVAGVLRDAAAAGSAPAAQ